MGDMLAHHEQLLSELRRIVSKGRGRAASLQKIADVLKNAGNYRWVGLYDVNMQMDKCRTLSGADRAHLSTQRFHSLRD